MPDPNKFQALRNAGFRVVPSCATCVCRKKTRRPGWGLCSALTYEHERHSGTKQMGVPDNGWCSHYELSQADLEDQVESYAEFFEPDSHAE